MSTIKEATDDTLESWCNTVKAPVVDKKNKKIKPKAIFTAVPDFILNQEKKYSCVLWNWAWKSTKWDKPLFNPHTPYKHASTQDSTTWTSSSIAIDAAKRSQMGFGIILTDDLVTVVIDLDKVRDATGRITPWATDLILRCKTYFELSPSGTGFKIFGTVKGISPCYSKIIRENGEIEIFYNRPRYVVVTGLSPNPSQPLIDITPIVKELLDEARTTTGDKKSSDTIIESRPPDSKEQFSKRESNSNFENQDTKKQTFNSFDSWLAQCKSDEEREIIRKALSFIPSHSWDDWYKYGAALHDSGYSWGREEWDDWSKKSANYDPISQEEMWNRFALSKTDTPATFASIIDDARKRGLVYPQTKDDLKIKNNSENESCGHGQGGEFSDDDEWSSATPPPLFEAQPFVFKEMEYLPRRQPIYGNHYTKNYVSCDVAVGGIGKTSLILVEALAITTGRPLLGIIPDERCNVLIFNGEDPIEELDLRLHAAINYYGIKPEEIEGRLFVNSGRDSELIVAGQTRDGVKIYEPLVEQLIAEIKRKNISVVIIDPFVGSHTVSENDNGAIDRVVKLFGRIAGLTNCSINLVHHTRKTNGNSASVEDGRGASSMLAGVRSARAFNPMSENEAAKASVENRRQYFKVMNGKSNMFLSSDQSQWFKMESFTILNGPFGAEGDSVGVCTAWEWPNPFDDIIFDDLKAAQHAVASGGPWRRSQQAKAWVGIPVADVLDLDLTDKSVKYKLNRIMEKWIKEGVFKVVIKRDEVRREDREFVEVGEWVK